MAGGNQSVDRVLQLLRKGSSVGPSLLLRLNGKGIGIDDTHVGLEKAEPTLQSSAPKPLDPLGLNMPQAAHDQFLIQRQP